MHQHRSHKCSYSTVQNIYFHFHLFTVQCMSSVYHAVKQNCASHHLGRLCLLTLDLHLVSKIMECTVVFFIVIICRRCIFFIKSVVHLRTGYILCQAWACIPTPENQNAQTGGPRFAYHLRLVRTSTPICYPTAKHRLGCLHHVEWQFAYTVPAS